MYTAFVESIKGPGQQLVTHFAISQLTTIIYILNRINNQQACLASH